MESVNKFIDSSHRLFQSLGVSANALMPTLAAQCSNSAFTSVAGVAPALFAGAYFASGDSGSKRLLSASLSLAGGVILGIGLLALARAKPAELTPAKARAEAEAEAARAAAEMAEARAEELTARARRAEPAEAAEMAEARAEAARAAAVAIGAAEMAEARAEAVEEREL